MSRNLMQCWLRIYVNLGRFESRFTSLCKLAYFFIRDKNTGASFCNIFSTTEAFKLVKWDSYLHKLLCFDGAGSSFVLNWFFFCTRKGRSLYFSLTFPSKNYNTATVASPSHTHRHASNQTKTPSLRHGVILKLFDWKQVRQ